MKTDAEREEWLQGRRNGIGGSDTPVIVLGEKHPFTKPIELWMEKKGLIDPRPPTPAMMRGTLLEGIAAEIYMQRTGRKTRRVNRQLRHKEHEWMFGNIDREIVSGHTNDGAGVLEIKCPGLRTFSKCKREGLPDYYQLQLQHYLAVMDRKWGALAVFSAELWEMVYFDIERDDAIIEFIIEKDSLFWKSLAEDTPPTEEACTPLPELPSIQGEVSFVRIESDEFEQAARDYWEAKAILEDASDLKESAEEKIKNLMTINGAAIAESSDSRFYFKTQDRRTTLDVAALKTALESAYPALDLNPFFKTKPLDSKTFRAYRLKEDDVNE